MADILHRLMTETWPAKMEQSALSALMAPGNAYKSTWDNPVTPEEMIAPAADLAGLIMGVPGVAKAIEPITSYPSTYNDMRQEAQGQMARGIEQVGRAVSGEDLMGYPVDSRTWEAAKGVANSALGALGYVASPVNAAIRTVVGEPIEENAGIPKEYSEFAASMALPGMGLTKINAVEKAVPAAVKAGEEVAQAAGRLSQSGAPVQVTRALASDVPGVQQAATGMKGVGGSYAAPAVKGGAGMGIRAYHGSPHDFDRFDLSKIGTGEGAQAYGHGLYFAENPATAQTYKTMLGAKYGSDPEVTARAALIANQHDRKAALDYLKREIADPREKDFLKLNQQAFELLQKREIPSRGRMYEVNINAKPEQFLDWDKPLSQQAASIQDAFKGIPQAPEIPGQLAYYRMAGQKLQSPETSAALKDAGIPGIKYLDQGSRGTKYWVARHPQGGTVEYPEEALARQFVARNPEYKLEEPNLSRNYVVFDDKLIDILKKYGLAGVSPLAALMMGQGNEAQAAP